MTEPSRTPSSEVPPGRYHLDSRSRLRYSGKHLFGAGTVHATFTVRSGELVVDEAGVPTSVVVTVEAVSFTSGNAKRDDDVRSPGLLDAETFPDITFASSSMRRQGDGWVVAGTGTAHGHSAPVELHVDAVTVEGTDLRIHGSAAHLDRTAFGITGSRGMVGKYLDLEVDALATPAT